MNPSDLAYAGISRQAEMIRDGEISSRELVSNYLERIDRINPQINAFCKVFGDEALSEAEAADSRRAKGETGPLLGVPVAFKDELDITGHVAGHGTAGFEKPATQDAEHVRRVRAAGAVVIGTTNLPELAICGFTESKTNGVTRNPWSPDHTPGGSSGGSAAAVAAGLVGAASGSDGAGSIRIPAAHCNLFGLKPQRGRISLAPLKDHWYGMSVTGCLTRSVADTALWFDVAAGAASGDVESPPGIEGSWVAAAAADPGKLRIGLATNAFITLAPPIVSDEVKAGVERVGEALRSIGHSVEETKINYGMIGNGISARYLKGIEEDYDNVPFSERLEARTEGFAKLGRITHRKLLEKSISDEAKHRDRLNQVFENFDAVITPVTGTPAVEVRKWEGKGALRTVLGMSRVYPFTTPWNFTGQPAASIPAGFTDDGRPVGAMLVVPPNREDLALAIAAQVEAEMNWTEPRPLIAG